MKPFADQPLSPEQIETFARREAMLLIEHPRIADLKTLLLNIGGAAVVWRDTEPHLDMILDRGELFDSTSVVLSKGERGGCHRNAARLYVCEEAMPVTGYSLSEDGLWRQHSWGCKDKTVIETTTVRALYFGARFTVPEANVFAFIELRDELFATYRDHYGDATA